MQDHVRLKFKTEILKHDEIMSTLPKAIRSSIARRLFFDVVECVYLFHGTSYNFLLQLVSPIFSAFHVMTNIGIIKTISYNVIIAFGLQYVGENYYLGHGAVFVGCGTMIFTFPLTHW